ncbi:proprotein convertase P-domain-containing protein [Limnoglobus roseus]|uniref:Putative beta-propeller-type glycoside hydrolase n=1 Tax=Limnoglobus roseus TaxID=2598579 RepID=A0A5C1AES6_9BACT|nr:proprotein convertase P-domain-containing protein [Limnoglobus roseus]QEL17919.1 putative beta-propeller-type glycoside hydrolase [Limnoglobus roseus]
MPPRNLMTSLRKWAFSPNHLGRKSLNTSLLFETIEDRIAPATLPTPTVIAPTATTASIALAQQVPAAANNNTTIDYINPQVVADPQNALHQVLVATRYTSNANGTALTAVTATTIDGGLSWTAITALARPRDPNLVTTANPNLYTDASSPAVAFGRDGMIYYVYLAHNTGKTSGAVLFNKAAFGTAPAATPTVLYRWLNADQALNPAIAVDNNVQTFVDPTTGVTFTDTLANRTAMPGRAAVYVAWNANSSANPRDITSPGGVLNFNPNPIQTAVSGDDGVTWSNPVPVNDGGYLTSPDNSRGVAPQIAISPGNSDTPGSLVFVWPQQVRGQNYAQIAYENTQPDGGSLTNLVPQTFTFTGTFDNATGKVNDAGAAVSPATVDTQSSKTFDLMIPAGTITDPNFTLQDLSINLGVVAPFLNHLRIELIAPDNTTTLTLLNNRTQGDNSNPNTPNGQPFPIGISGTLPGFTPANPNPPSAGLGIINGANSTYTVFSDTAARRINDPNSAFPYIGAFRPEGSSGYQSQLVPISLISGFLATAGLTNATAATLNGSTWHLRITDFRNDRLTLNGGGYTAPEFLQTFGLAFSSVPNGLGTDQVIAGAQAAPIGVDFNNAPLVGSATYPATSPTAGVPSTVSVAFDNSLGSFTPFGGNFYVAYTGVTLNTANPAQVTDTNIMLSRGTIGGGLGTPVQVNDDTPNDNFTEGNRPQFIPAVTVDSTTGTAVVTWYDTRLDANQTRAATFIATSIDGGATFSNQTVTVTQSVDGTQPFLNQPKKAIDVITGNSYTLQPVPSNVPLSNALGLGIRQSVIASGGKIYAYWSGNANAAGISVQSARAVTATGPRVISGDLGPVLTASTSGAGSYNTTLAADGTRRLDGILITFDRTVEVADAILTSNYTVRYHNPYNPVGADTMIPVTLVTPVDPDGRGGATQFLIRFAAQSAIGTYSYSVSPTIRDRVRSGVMTVVPSGGPVQSNNNTPVVVPDGSPTGATSTVAVNLPPGLVVSNVTVRINVSTTFDGDLRIFLRSPSGTRVPLVLNRGGGGDNFSDTTFDDSATTSIGAGTAPFTGSFRPESPLSVLSGEPGTGTWTLELFDDATPDIATLNNWTLNVTGGVVTVVVTKTGNFMDQDADSNPAEVNVDAFAMPKPTSGVPFTAPYDVTTQPLIIPGPHMIGSSVVNGGSATDPDLVLTGVASAVDITFDRDLNTVLANGPVFTKANIVRLTGPAGVIYDRNTATTNPLTVVSMNARTWRVGFPGQVLSGTYTIEIDPQFSGAVNLGANQPALIDTNLNAGLDVLRGGSPTNGVTVDNNYPATFSGAAATIAPAVGGIASTTEFPLSIPDSFIIAQSVGHQIQVVLNVSSATLNSQNVVDLIGELVAPDGTTIRLFTKAGNATRPPGNVWFSSTALTDSANTPIQSGFQPFSAGPYNPQFPLGDLNNVASLGTWKLRIINTGTQTPNLTSWSLRLPQVKSGTGLGETNADRLSVSFRVFNQDPTDSLTQKVWTPVGPASENGGANSSRTNGLAVDPSDPSGNTVYLGAASGGLWKTTNFLTQDAAGPSWIPLIDNGPTYALNVVSIAVFPRNNDPHQSIIFVLTGEGDTGSPGVGVLRSMDGGANWVVLDSLNNVVPGTETAPNFGGTIASIDTASRDRTFFGKTAFKIIIDPTAVNDTDKNLIVYAAFGGSGGVYRSNDTGRHWSLIQAGDATDIVLAAGSAATGTGNLQILYAAFRGQGVYIANPAFNASGMTLLTGTPPGNGNFIDADVLTQPRVPIASPSATPNGAKGRILLATPFLTNNKVLDLNYQGWLYALVIKADNSLDGLYLTKDFGGNWTKVSLAEYLQGNPPAAGFGTNNYTRNDHDNFAAPPGTSNPLPGQGNYDVGFAIDPLNPNVVYIGGTNDNAIGPSGPGTGGFIRVDTTGIMDALAFVAYDNGSTVGGNSVQFTANTGNLVTKGAGTKSQLTNANLGPGQTYGFSGQFGTPTAGLSGVNTGFLNVYRNPNDPFAATSSLYFTNVASIRNTGTGARYQAIFPEAQTDVHRVITFVDPVTGQTRLIVGDDQGVASAVYDGDGNLVTGLGSSSQAITLPTKIRNGNLQTVQFYSSTVHPSQLAAEIAGALYYGVAQDNGFPRSNTDILQTGVGTSPAMLSWAGAAGDGSWALTDQTGSGTNYQYHWPCCNNDVGDPNQFFLVNSVGKTQGLIQPGDNPVTGAGNWAMLGGPKFAVNPTDASGLAISSLITGKFFRSVNQGVQWFQVTGAGTPTDYSQAIAFGSPDIGATNANQSNNFIYAGHGSLIAVTFNGGTSWTDISNGLGGGTVQQIVPDTTRGSKAAYAVTNGGVFFNPDSSAAGSTWVNITGNIFSLSDPIFNDANPAPQNGETASLRNLTSLAIDWRYAIPDASATAPSATFPVLYAGGYGGVFRSLDRGQTWEIYPKASSYSYTDPSTGLPASIAIPDAGYFPSTLVTQLTLSQGNIDPASGQPIQQTGGLNMLTAATYGRGTWSIRLGTPENDPAIAAIAQFQVVKQSGPQVIGVDVTTQPTSPSNSGRVVVSFNSPVLASTFTTGRIQIKDANGQVLTITSVSPISNTSAPANFPLIPGNPSDFHNLYAVTFTAATPVATGFAQVTISPTVTDYAGFGLNEDDDFTNGETTADPNNGGAPADAYNGSLMLFGATAATTLADFSDGAGGLSLDGFTATGLWHATATATGATTTPGHSAPEIAYYGIDASGNYNTGARNFGTLDSPPIAVPAGMSTQLSFNYRLQSESGVSFDVASVQVSTNGGATFTTIASNGAGSIPQTLTWSPLSVNLTPFAGQTIIVRFSFDTVDGFANSTLGWQIDDVSVSSSPLNAKPGNLHIDQPVTTVAGAPTRVVVSSLDPTTGLPDPSYTGTISLTATINGQPVVLTPQPVVEILNVSEVGNTVTVRTVGPVAFVAGQQVRIAGVTTAGYNGDFVVASVTANGFTYTNPTAGLAADASGGSVTGPEVPAAALAGSPAPVPSGALPTTYQFTAADAGSHVFTLYYLAGSNPTTGQTLLSVTDLTTPAATKPNPARSLLTVTSGTADHFVLTGLNGPVLAGDQRSLTVMAVDSFGNVDPTYTGTVSFTTTDTNSAAAVPTTYTFTAGDAGVHTFTNGVVLATATNLTNSFQTVTASDSTNPLVTLTGSQKVLVLPGPTNLLTVDGFTSPVVAGTAGSFTVNAFDAFGNVASGYTGTVTFSSNDGQATFAPTTYTFTAADNGSKTFTNGATLRTSGSRTITATDTVTPLLAGTQSGILVTPAATSQLLVAQFPTSATAGVAYDYRVAAADQFGNVTPAYRGTVTFSTDDAQGSFVPAAYTFTSADSGARTFTGGATLRTAGTHTITATDSVTASIAGAQTGIVVVPAAAAVLTVGGFTSPVVAGTAGSFMVNAFDAFGNAATGYTGTVAFSSNDGQATFAPATYAFTAADSGSKTFTAGATLRTAGSRTITATDTATASVTGTQSGIVVTPAATSQFLVNSFPASITAGVSGSFIVSAADAFGNVTPTYTGTAVFSTDDAQGTFAPTGYTFTAGDNGSKTFTGGATLRTAGTHTITATDPATNFTGTQSNILVTPAAASSLTLGGFTSPVVAGTSGSFTVNAFDAFGNAATGYTGTVAFSSDDGQATFAPATYAFTAADSGSKTFTAGATLRTAGSRTITATDAANSTLTASQTGIQVTPNVTSKFALTGLPSPIAPGAAAALTITALDVFGNVTPAYTGTLTLTTSDNGATLNPTTVTFGPADGGTRTLPGAVSFRHAGTQTVTASDSANGLQGSITASVSVPTAVGFRIVGVPASFVSGSTLQLSITAIDVFGDRVPGYTGTVNVTSSDPTAVITSPVTFTPSDAGTKLISVKLNSLGANTLSVTDSTISQVATTVPVQVVPQGLVASRFLVTVSPSSAAIGLDRTVTVRAVDDAGTLVPGYSGTVAITTTDPSAILPPNATLTNGVGTFNVILRTIGSHTITATDTVNANLTGSQTSAVKGNVTPSTTVAVGAGATGTVAIYDNVGNRKFEFTPFPGTPGGTRVTTGDVTGDGVDDYIAGTGPGTSTQVVVYDGVTGNQVFSFLPFESTFTGGVFVTAGDVNNDGIADIAITPDQGGGPRVILLNGKDFVKLADYFGIDDVNFRGGARAAIGDMNGDGFGDVAVGAGFLGGPRVSVADGKLLLTGQVKTLFNDFFIFNGPDIDTLRNGVFLAVGDINGDGFGDLIAGGGPNGGPRVLAVDGKNLITNNSGSPVNIVNAFVRNNGDRGGIRIATKNLDGDRFADLVVGDGEDLGSTITAYKGSTLVSGAFNALYETEVFPGVNGGVFVG